MNTEKLEKYRKALKDYLRRLIEIISNHKNRGVVFEE